MVSAAWFQKTIRLSAVVTNTPSGAVIRSRCSVPVGTIASPRGPRGDAMVPTGTLHRLLITAPDGVFVTTADNRIVFWNHAAETMMGYRARDAVGRPCAEVFAGRGPR